MGIPLSTMQAKVAQRVNHLFKRGNKSVSMLHEEIEHRRGIAANIRIRYASLSDDEAEGIIANAIISCQHALDELKPAAQELQVQIEFEDHLWDRLAHTIMSAPGEKQIHQALLNATIDSILESTKEQERLLGLDVILSSRRAA